MSKAAASRQGVAERVRARELQQAAAELFFARGYEATTVRQIAKALDIKSASIYYHWESKEEILFDLVRSAMDQLHAGALSVLEQESRPELRLAGLVVNHVVMHALRPKEATLGETELRSLTGKRRREVQRMRDDYEALVLGVLDEGSQRGVFDVLDLKLTAYAVISQSTNVVIWYREGGRLSLEQLAAVYASFALRTVGGPPVEQSRIAGLALTARAFHEAWR
jgi:TetR/AcrR family transcriptional regulator, cholesterol catabolism regulator